MKKELILEMLKKLRKEFETIGKINTWCKVYNLIDTDYIVNDIDVYEVNNSNQSISIINDWVSHIELNIHYMLYVEMVKIVNNRVVSEWVKIEHDEKYLLIKLHNILKELSKTGRFKNE